MSLSPSHLVLISGGRLECRREGFVVMLTMTIWWLAISLEALLLIRGLQEKLVRQFPIFYSYILFVFVEEFLRFIVYRWFSSRYSEVYWTTQFLGLVIGSAVIFEIYRVGLRSFPGTARMARYLLLIVFGAVFAKALANPSGGLFWWFAKRSVMLERNLRIVQGLAILSLVSLFLWYAIPFGKNLKGILFGYSLFIAMSIVQLTLSYTWADIQLFWPYVQPVSYLLVLGLWASALWSAQSVPEGKPATQLEDDYEVLVASTRTQLRRALARLGWTARL
jgi:hypothetical protein